MNNKIKLEKEIAWASQDMPRTLRQVAALPDLSQVRLACCMHLDMKMIPLVQGILEKGAQVFLTTGNPTTVQDDVVAWLVERGAEACAWRDMSDADWQQSWKKRLPGSRRICAKWARILPPYCISAGVWQHRRGP
ncbi:adenosylhomocysteinase [Klebsiella michiganensis]|nr:adenosylhomocysteinase [Klebsiella michiganensis]